MTDALARYYHDSVSAGIVDIPLLLPIIDVSQLDDLNISQTAGQKYIIDILNDFYQIVPPQLRFTLATATQPRSYPIILLAPSPYLTWQGDFIGQINKQLLKTADLPAVWILDSAWHNTDVLSAVISSCDFQSDKSYQASNFGGRYGYAHTRITYFAR